MLQYLRARSYESVILWLGGWAAGLKELVDFVEQLRRRLVLAYQY